MYRTLDHIFFISTYFFCTSQRLCMREAAIGLTRECCAIGNTLLKYNLLRYRNKLHEFDCCKNSCFGNYLQQRAKRAYFVLAGREFSFFPLFKQD